MENGMLFARIFIIFFILIGFFVGVFLYGESKIKQVQSGMFFGFSLGCLFILLFGFD